MKNKILLAYVLFICLSGTAFGSTIYEYTGTPDSNGTGVLLPQSLGVKVNPTIAATAGVVNVSVKSQNSPDWINDPLKVLLCSDNAGVPNLGNCTEFSTTHSTAPPASYIQITYTGVYPVTVGTPFWVVFMSTTSSLGQYLVQNATGGGPPGYIYNGSNWTESINGEFVVTVSTATIGGAIGGAAYHHCRFFGGCGHH